MSRPQKKIFFFRVGQLLSYGICYDESMKDKKYKDPTQNGYQIFKELHKEQIKGFKVFAFDEYVRFAKESFLDPAFGKLVFKHYKFMLQDFARYGTN